jgi:hypothetical protein
MSQTKTNNIITKLISDISKIFNLFIFYASNSFRNEEELIKAYDNLEKSVSEKEPIQKFYEEKNEEYRECKKNKSQVLQDYLSRKKESYTQLVEYLKHSKSMFPKINSVNIVYWRLQGLTFLCSSISLILLVVLLINKIISILGNSNLFTTTITLPPLPLFVVLILSTIVGIFGFSFLSLYKKIGKIDIHDID